MTLHLVRCNLPTTRSQPGEGPWREGAETVAGVSATCTRCCRTTGGGKRGFSQKQCTPPPLHVYELMQVSSQLVSVELNNYQRCRKWAQSPAWESSVYITDGRSTELAVLCCVKFHKVFPLLYVSLSHCLSFSCQAFSTPQDRTNVVPQENSRDSRVAALLDSVGRGTLRERTRTQSQELREQFIQHEGKKRGTKVAVRQNT